MWIIFLTLFLFVSPTEPPPPVWPKVVTGFLVPVLLLGLVAGFFGYRQHVKAMTTAGMYHVVEGSL